MYDLYNRSFRSFLQPSIPLTNNEDITPFFIVGSGRSGNTLLRRILNTHDGIVIPPETYVLGEIFRLHNLHKSVKWEQYVNIILSTFEYHDQFFTFEIESLRELALELKQFKPSERSLALILDKFYHFYAEIKGEELERWGDKTPINAAYVYRLKKSFSNAQFIHIVRDGVDVAYSYVNANLYEDYETAALRWKKSVNFLKKFGKKFPESYLEVTYEQLVRAPENTTKEVCTFLDIAFRQEMISSDKEASKLGDVRYLDHHNNVFNKINTDSIGKGRSKVPVEVLSNLKKRLNPLLEQLEYKRISV
jgi:hypothetical protein